MPGGNPEGLAACKTYFSSHRGQSGYRASPAAIGWASEGAGHYVKMVHNGIEYGDMQLICEAYHLLKNGLGLNADELSSDFSQLE